MLIRMILLADVSQKFFFMLLARLRLVELICLDKYKGSCVQSWQPADHIVRIIMVVSQYGLLTICVEDVLIIWTDS